jgi:hypothetical protein
MESGVRNRDDELCEIGGRTRVDSSHDFTTLITSKEAAERNCWSTGGAVVDVVVALPRYPDLRARGRAGARAYSVQFEQEALPASTSAASRLP